MRRCPARKDTGPKLATLGALSPAHWEEGTADWLPTGNGDAAGQRLGVLRISSGIPTGSWTVDQQVQSLPNALNTCLPPKETEEQG